MLRAPGPTSSIFGLIGTPPERFAADSGPNGSGARSLFLMDRAMLLELLARAERHVEEGEEHLSRQRHVVAERQRQGLDASDALTR